MRKRLKAFRKNGNGGRRRRRTCGWCERSQSPNWRITGEKYDRSVKGKARWLRKDHGYGMADSLHLAGILLDPYTQCAICGVPRRWLRAQEILGLHWKGLSVDHVKAGGPSILSNTRILCRLCNGTRGAEQYTDTEVLHRVSAWYEYRGYASRDLWWLHTAPGRGGLTKLGTNRIHFNE